LGWQGYNFNPRRRRATWALCCDYQAANTIISQQSRIGPEATSWIDHGTCRLRAGDLSDRQLRVVSDGSANANDDNVDKRTQPMEVLNASRTIDVL